VTLHGDGLSSRASYLIDAPAYFNLPIYLPSVTEGWPRSRHTRTVRGDWVSDGGYRHTHTVRGDWVSGGGYGAP